MMQAARDLIISKEVEKIQFRDKNMGRVNEHGKRRRAGSALSLGGLDRMRHRSNSETKHRDMIKVVKQNSRPKGKSIN